MKDTYVLFICDQWKGTDSHRLIGLASSLTQVRKAVRELLKNEVIEFESETGYEAKDIQKMDMNEMKNNLRYFNITSVQVNQIETTGSYV